MDGTMKTKKLCLRKAMDQHYDILMLNIPEQEIKEELD